jgi:hypothetical protein
LWYSTRVASKSVSQTNIFQQYVYLKLIEKLDSEGDLFFITDDDELLKNVGDIRGGILIKKHLIAFKGRMRLLKYFLFSILYRLFFRNSNADKYDVIIHGWIDSRVFSKPGEYNDAYFGDLQKFLEARRYKVGRFMPLYVHPSYAFKLHKRFDNVIQPLTYLKVSDFFKVLFSRISINVPATLDAKVNDQRILVKLVINEERKERFTKNYQDNLLLYYAYKRFDKLLSERAVIINLFENQPWEKMLNLAFSKKTRIGYQHTIIPDNWLDYRVSEFEMDVPAPSIILSTGKIWVDFLTNYYHDIPIDISGYLRTSSLNNDITLKKDKNKNVIIVALPIYPHIALSLQEKVLEVLRSNGHPLQEYQIKIKPHPYLPRESILVGAFGRYSNCSFVTNGMEELIAASDIMITSGSTVAFESAFSGCKTLYLVPEAFSDGTEACIENNISVAYEDDFLQKLEELLQGKVWPRPNKASYFANADYEKFTAYLGNPMDKNEVR